jgi:hypothetical protein
MTGRLSWLWVVAAGCGLFSCASDPTKGYSFRSTFDADVRSVAVPVFENKTYSKGLEVSLTDALIKEIQRATPWTVVSQDRADTVLTGTITDSTLRRLSVTRGTGLVQEVAVRLTVDFDWRSNRTGETLVSRRGFDSFETFVPSRGTGERLELGQTSAVQELAHDIVAELRSNW